MADNSQNVKGTLSGAILDWIDHHPRTGWYVSIWALLVTLNLLLDLVELML